MKGTKTLAGMLALLLAVSLAACGRPASQETDASASAGAAAEEAPAQENTEETVTAEEGRLLALEEIPEEYLESSGQPGQVVRTSYESNTYNEENRPMKRKSAFVLTVALMFGLTACGAANEPDNTSNSSAQTEPSQVAESSVQDSQDNGENSTESVDNTENAESGKILIAYFAAVPYLSQRHGSGRRSKGTGPDHGQEEKRVSVFCCTK